MKDIKIIAPKHDKGKHIIVVDGEKYILEKSTEKRSEEILHFTKLTDEEEYERTLDKLAEKISKKTNVKKMIKQALYQLPMDDFKKVRQEMEKEKPKVRNNEGCFFLSVGKVQVPLRE